MQIKIGHKGVWIALVIICLWFAHLTFLLQLTVSFSDFSTYFFIFIQTHLYTGLFITAHDAMHGTVAPHHKKLNSWIGHFSIILYAALSFDPLNQKHHQHHRYVHTEKDPDYHNCSFMVWYLKFIKEYMSIRQLISLGIVFSILSLWNDKINLLLFWVIPSLLSSLQLFYFGTYLPHKGEHTNAYFSHSQRKNHLFAFCSCYFFGYHYEHHESPVVPWWSLWRLKK